MPLGPKSVPSRREALAGLLTFTAAASVPVDPLTAGPISGGRAAAPETSPTFSETGPDARRYGSADGYPVPGRSQADREGNPYRPEHRVGAFSHFDEIYRTRSIGRAIRPWAFRRSPVDIHYASRGQRLSLEHYLSGNPVTGLLIAKDDVILAEHYQYGRTDRDRLLSQSMVKSLTGLLIGIAVSEGPIRSVDDLAEAYVPGLKGSEYGRTPIRDLLHMSSGVEFGEEREGGRDLDRLWADMVRGAWLFPKGTVGSIRQFNHRLAPPGTRFSYASIEPDVLAQVLRGAVGRTASDYLREKVWEPIGAEADAGWFLDAEGFELAHFGFNAVLRDYARLARLLAHDGAWNGRQIVPERWMLDATTVRPSDAHLAVGAATPAFGYGYLLWLLPGPRRQFALFGACGQRICVDPAAKLVMVQTALETTTEIWPLWASIVAEFGGA